MSLNPLIPIAGAALGSLATKAIERLGEGLDFLSVL